MRLKWWLAAFLNFSLTYRYIELDRFGLRGSSNGSPARLALILE